MHYIIDAMSIASYLPSSKFAVMVGALVLSGSLVLGAQAVTHRPQGSFAQVQPADQTSAVSTDPNWQQTLDEIQASSGVSLPKTPDPQSVNALVASAKTDNLTDTVGRTLFIKLTDAKAQGLGGDAPTQDALIAQALAAAGTNSTPAYTMADLTLVPQSKATLHAYGNDFMSANFSHPDASAWAVMLAVGYAVDYGDPAKLAPLPAAAKAYGALAKDLAAIPVPDTLAPLHVKVINDFLAMRAAIADMQTVLSDPLRGMRGVQQFTSSSDEASRVLTTLSGTFGTNGILFTKDEPGAEWSAFVSSISQ